MKSVKFFLLIFFCAGAVLADPIDNEWYQFKLKYSKKYENPQKDAKAFENFKENSAFINKHNSDPKAFYKVSVNEYADLGEDDFSNDDDKRSAWEFIKSVFSMSVIGPQEAKFNESAKIPNSVDWSKRIAFRKVDDLDLEKDCECSYAFASVGVLEAHHFIRNNKALDLSDQEIIDCSKFNAGCSYGVPAFSYNYLIEHGIALDKDYKYNAKKGECKNSEAPRSEAKVYGYAGVKGVENLKKALDQFGPLVIGVDGDEKSFIFYDNGVYDDVECSDTKIHAYQVILYGYGFDNLTGVDYWLIRNSWSKDWGEDGYMRIKIEGSCINEETGFFPLLDPAAAKDNVVVNMAEFGLLFIAIIAGLILFCCCCCCCCALCIKYICIDCCCS